jgi:hypothetical protein
MSCTLDNQLRDCPDFVAAHVRQFGIVATAAVSVLLSAISANASTMTYDISFTSGSFNAAAFVGPAGTPPASASGNFTLTIDTSQTYANETAGITLNSLGVTAGEGLAFSYPLTFSPYSDILVIGGSSPGAGYANGGTNNFYLQIDDFSTTPTFLQFGYTVADPAEDYFYTNQGDGSVSVSLVSTTPLPAALPLFATGLGAMGLFGWRRKREKRWTIA